ncbi:MAG TPA: glycosyltransferase [Aquifex aeolicus]|nr:glycosyltransferase [Aquifex aeolicus]
MRTFKVLQVVDGLGWGGTKEQVYLTTRELARLGIDIGIALAYQYTEMVERLKPYPVRIHFFEDHKGSKSRFDPQNWWRLKKVIEENGYDIVVGNSPHAIDFIRFTFPLLRKKPKLVFVRRSGRTPSPFSKWFKYRIADRIVVVSEGIYKLLKKKNFFPKKLVYIPSGIDLERFGDYRDKKRELRRKLNLPLKGKIFINVANWNPPVKGQDILLEAFSLLRCKDCFLLLVGHETDSPRAKELIRKLGLEGKVWGLGFRKDIPDLLNAGDFFVLSSRLEGIAGALLQAMATGMVAISTAVGGIPSYLKDGRNGFLVESENPKALLKAMERVLSLEENEYWAIAQRAKDTAKLYSIENTAKKYGELFKELAG